MNTQEQYTETFQLNVEYIHPSIRQLIAPTKQEVWGWLKAERQWKDKVRQWLRAEGVKPGVLMDRRMGRPEAPLYINRAARRARLRAFRRLQRIGAGQ